MLSLATNLVLEGEFECGVGPQGRRGLLALPALDDDLWCGVVWC